ncbi:MAG TPA: hypothetical protein VEI57_13185 [Nitrospirota bacterium]|nr:hypothetical protein [Nitrospirota bacterium]
MPDAENYRVAGKRSRKHGIRKNIFIIYPTQKTSATNVFIAGTQFQNRRLKRDELNGIRLHEFCQFEKKSAVLRSI